MNQSLLKKYKNELKEHFNLRKKIVLYLNPKNKKEFIYYSNLSNIILNKIYLKCKYEKKTEELIKNILKSMNNKNILKKLHEH
jgi:hypothetical protein